MTVLKLIGLWAIGMAILAAILSILYVIVTTGIGFYVFILALSAPLALMIGHTVVESIRRSRYNRKKT